MGPTRSAPVRIDLVRVLELLRTHITAALCQTVFHAVRITERQRLWTLDAYWGTVMKLCNSPLRVCEEIVAGRRV